MLHRQFFIVCLLGWFGSSAEIAKGDDSGNPTVLRIFSYNILHGAGLDGRIDLDRIAGVIAEEKPDLVALQEVDKGCQRSGQKDQAAELGKRLNMQHRFGSFMDLQGGQYGMAILSAWPITKTVRHPLPDGAEPRCALEVQVRVPGLSSRVSFICIHNDWTSEPIRTKQVQVLMRRLADAKCPLILAGDFNSERPDPSMDLVRRSGWTLLDKTGSPETWPSDNPKMEIDFFAVRNFDNFTYQHYVIEETVASDHRPLYAKLSLQKSSE